MIIIIIYQSFRFYVHCTHADKEKIARLKNAECIRRKVGYPSSVELHDNKIFTVYYQVEKNDAKPCLMGTFREL